MITEIPTRKNTLFAGAGGAKNFAAFCKAGDDEVQAHLASLPEDERDALLAAEAAHDDALGAAMAALEARYDALLAAALSDLEDNFPPSPLALIEQRGMDAYWTARLARPDVVVPLAG